jgi:hypothetical protein
VKELILNTVKIGLPLSVVAGMTILLPAGIGILIRSFFPKAADTIGPPPRISHDDLFTVE